jgi:hypothetical protein
LTKLKEGDVLFQEVAVARTTTFRLAGNDVRQNLTYHFLSSLRVEKRLPEGGFQVVQRVEAARLDGADEVFQTLLGDSIDRLKGQTFKLTLDPYLEVIAFEGTTDPVKALQGTSFLGGPALMLASLMDQDGWRELARLSFFMPEQPLKQGARWERPMTHGWGPLGGWTGKAAYAYLGPQAVPGQKKPLQRVGYQYDLTYEAPKAGAGVPGVPLQVNQAKFQPPAASGVIYYDADRARVAAVEERFQVRGNLHLNLLGANTPVELEETQSIRLQIFDRPPAVR